MNRHFIKRLNREYHDIRSFRCGKSPLDDLLLDSARLEGTGNTYVVVSRPNSRKILAYFILLPDPQDILAEDEIAVQFTAVLLNVLAVDSRHQRKGLGKWILAQI